MVALEGSPQPRSFWPLSLIGLALIIGFRELADVVAGPPNMLTCLPSFDPGVGRLHPAPPPFGAELVVPLVGKRGGERVGGDGLVGVGYEEWLWAFDVGFLLLGVPPSACVSYLVERIPRAPVVSV